MEKKEERREGGAREGEREVGEKGRGREREREREGGGGKKKKLTSFHRGKSVTYKGKKISITSKVF